MKSLLWLSLLLASLASAQQQVVAVGTVPNDGTGDPARTAFQKLNANDAQAFGTAGFVLSPSIPTPVALGSDITLATGNYHVQIDPSVAFDHLYKFDNLFTYIPKPVGGFELYSATVGPSYDSYHNFMGLGVYLRVTSTSANSVSLWGICDSQVSGSNCWAHNPVGITSASGATSISDETDCVTLVAGGLNYCIVAASTGYNPAQVAFQIQTNRFAASFINGINFNSTAATGQAVTGNLIMSSNSTIATYAIKLPGIYAQEMYLPSFQVHATPVNKLVVTGASGTGVTATLTFASTVNFPWVGANITAASVVPSGYNATAQVTAATATSVSYLNGTSAAYTSGGGITVSNPTITVTGGSLASTTCTLSYADASATGYPAAGNKIIVADVVASGNSLGQNLTGYNGQFTVVTASATSLTYTCALAAGNYVSGGTIAPYPTAAVTAALDVQAANPPGNTVQLNVVSAGLGSSNAGLQLNPLGTGLLNLGPTQMAAGTTFTVSDFTGCGTTNGTPTSVTGGAQTGSFVTASSGTTCSVVITINGATGSTATHGWWCQGADITSAVAMVQSAKSQATCTLKGTINAITDTVVFHAMAY